MVCAYRLENISPLGGAPPIAAIKNSTDVRRLLRSRTVSSEEERRGVRTSVYKGLGLPEEYLQEFLDETD